PVAPATVCGGLAGPSPCSAPRVGGGGEALVGSGAAMGWGRLGGGWGGFSGERGVERQLAEARRGVLHAIAGLTVRVAVEPLAPARLHGVGGRAPLVERVAVLEVH